MISRESIRVVDLYLDVKNPRKETASQEEAIAWLCENENIDKLAEDIVKNGLNPLEVVGVLAEQNYVRYVLEGNRRVCALKLLAEPELAPNSSLKKKFKNLSSILEQPIHTLDCICFSSREDADIWLDRLHEGELGGVGRKRWNPIQIARRSKRTTNRRALMILEYALQNNWVNQDDIQNKLTTATRYLNNEKLRFSIGLGDSLDDLSHTRPKVVFDSTLEKFIKDLISSSTDGAVSSRADQVKIEKYAEELLSDLEDQTTHEEKPLLASESSKPSKEKKPKRDKAHKPPTPPKLAIRPSRDLEAALDSHGNTKLRSLYYSLCAIDLTNNDYIPLVTVGTWSFVESLCRDCGSVNNDFSGFIGGVNKKNLFEEEQRKSINAAAQELTKHGNMTKHDAKYALFSGEAIASIMETLTPILLFLLEQQQLVEENAGH